MSIIRRMQEKLIKGITLAIVVAMEMRNKSTIGLLS